MTTSTKNKRVAIDLSDIVVDEDNIADVVDMTIFSLEVAVKHVSSAQSFNSRVLKEIRGVDGKQQLVDSAHRFFLRSTTRIKPMKEAIEILYAIKDRVSYEDSGEISSDDMAQVQGILSNLENLTSVL